MASKSKPLSAKEVQAVVKKLPAWYLSNKKGAGKKGLNLDINAIATLIQVLWGIFQQIKPPKPPKPPEPPPVDPPPVDPPPVCPPGYIWDAAKGGCVQSPVDPPVDPKCQRPDGIKLGWRDARKIQPGWRNMFNVTPTIGGVPAPEGCGEYYLNTYGEPEAFQSLEGGFQKDPVERASGDSYGCILVMATNSEDLWKNGSYAEAGKMTVAVSYPWLTYWVAQDGVMGTDGKMTGFGNNQKSYQIPK